MASKTTNRVTEALKARHRAELAAVDAAATAETASVAATERRAVALQRLDADVGDAQQAHDVAVTVVATLMTEDVAASVLGVDVAQVRAARKRAPADAVQESADTLMGNVPRVRRPDRPRRGRPPRASVADAASAKGGDGAQESTGEAAPPVGEASGVGGGWSSGVPLDEG